jgi:hypothetical protein
MKQFLSFLLSDQSDELEIIINPKEPTGDPELDEHLKELDEWVEQTNKEAETMYSDEDCYNFFKKQATESGKSFPTFEEWMNS